MWPNARISVMGRTGGNRVGDRAPRRYGDPRRNWSAADEEDFKARFARNMRPRSPLLCQRADLGRWDHRSRHLSVLALKPIGGAANRSSRPDSASSGCGQTMANTLDIPDYLAAMRALWRAPVGMTIELPLTSTAIRTPSCRSAADPGGALYCHSAAYATAARRRPACGRRAVPGLGRALSRRRRPGFRLDDEGAVADPRVDFTCTLLIFAAHYHGASADRAIDHAWYILGDLCPAWQREWRLARHRRARRRGTAGPMLQNPHMHLWRPVWLYRGRPLGAGARHRVERYRAL